MAYYICVIYGQYFSEKGIERGSKGLIEKEVKSVWKKRIRRMKWEATRSQQLRVYVIISLLSHSFSTEL